MLSKLLRQKKRRAWHSDEPRYLANLLVNSFSLPRSPV